MKSFPQNLLLGLIALSLGACATHPRLTVPEATIQAPKPAPQTIGRIYAVNAQHGFAVIETAQVLETGTELQARDIAGKETSVLKVTPEKKNPFIVADIMKGKPQPGETVTK